MNPLTHEWVEKAEGDWATANRELRARKMPNYDAVCFHAQQCAEKYLKARLQEANTSFPPTHDLIALLKLLAPIEPAWTSLLPFLRALTQLAVSVRYPGLSSNKAMARQAVVMCRDVRQTVRRSLNLPA